MMVLWLLLSIAAVGVAYAIGCDFGRFRVEAALMKAAISQSPVSIRGRIYHVMAPVEYERLGKRTCG